MNEYRHRVNDWLRALYGDNETVLDETGRIYLTHSDDIGLVICVPDEADDVYIYADLMRVPDQPDQEFFEQVLALNGSPQLNFGAHIFLERQSNQLVLLYSSQVGALDIEKFGNILSNIPKAIQSLRLQLIEYAQDIKTSNFQNEIYQSEFRT